MGGPTDLRMHPDAPVRLFTVDESNALVPLLDEVFRRLDPKLARLRELKELVEDAEAYWGDGLASAPADDRERYSGMLQEHADLERSVQGDIDEVRSLGCEFKDLQRGLIDFPARVDGEIAYLCWQRGEERVGWWHTLEGGFAGRKALRAEAEH